MAHPGIRGIIFKMKKFIEEKNWHLDEDNTEERHIPGDFFKKYKMHDKIGALGGLYVKGRDGCDDGWYLGAGTADAEANFSKMPGFTTPQKKKRRRVGKPPAAARNLRSRVAGSN